MGYALAFLAAMLWGFAYALDHKLVHTLSLPTLMLLGTLSNGVLLIPILLFQKESTQLWAIDSQTWIKIGLSNVALFIASFCTLESIRIIGASKAASLEISYPLFTTLFIALMFHERISGWALIGTILILVGTILILKS